MATVVQLAEVTKRFGRLEVVKRLDLDIKEGEFLTLLGPSGCGKTTTLRLISGFEVPEGGEIRISGRVVNGVPPFHRPVNTVFQTYALFPHMTVADNVRYGLTLKRLPRREVRERVAAMLDRVGLGDRHRSYPHQLSGGQMQRVALARALVNEPQVLLLDEPLSALDAKLRRAMQLELKHMQESLGITFLYVTHDQEEAMTMSDRVAVMNAGRIEQLGPPSELFEAPQTLFTAEFLGIGNLLEGKVTEAGVGRSRIEFSGGHSLVVEGPGASAVRPATNAVIAIRPQKVRLHASETDQPASANQFRGRLTDVIYVGTTVRLHFALPGGETVQAENLPENLPFDYRALAPGDEMILELPPEQLLVYPR